MTVTLFASTVDSLSLLRARALWAGTTIMATTGAAPYSRAAPRKAEDSPQVAVKAAPSIGASAPAPETTLVFKP